MMVLLKRLLVLTMLLGGWGSWRRRRNMRDMSGNLVHGVMVRGGGKRVTAGRRRHGGVVRNGPRGGLPPSMSGAVLRGS